MSGRLLNAEQAAELLGVPKTWVLAEARADRIPHIRLGRYVRYEASELEAWWQARRRGPHIDQTEAAQHAATTKWPGGAPTPPARPTRRDPS